LNVDRERIQTVAPHPNRTGGFPASGFPVRGRKVDKQAQTCNSGLLEELRQPRRLLPRSPLRAVYCAFVAEGSAWFSEAPARSALRHYAGPFGRTFLRVPTPRPCLPWLHDHYSFLRYYGGSDPDRPFRRRPWFPDSRHSNFLPFHLQSSAYLHQPRSTPSALVALFCFGLRHCYAGSPDPPTETSSLWSPLWEHALRTGSSFPVALHPGLSPRRSYFPFLALQCRPGQGLSPCCSNALSGAHSRG
jgi:hypothetical protein